AAGWMAGASVALTDWLAAVVDAGGSYKTISSFGSEVHVSVHTVMGGVRASAGVGKVTEFGQVLVGIVRGSGTAFGFASTSHAFGLQPGIGFEIPLNQTFAGRAELDVRFIHSQPNGNNAAYEYRFVAGIVYRFRKYCSQSIFFTGAPGPPRPAARRCGRCGTIDMSPVWAACLR